MGYACPVCETPQADAGHLANHLAITAIARGGEHAAWLDEHAPAWGSLDEAGLADRVVEEATETEFPQVFEDTSDTAGANRAVDGFDPGRVAGALVDADDDVDVEGIVERAKELTAARRADSETE
jgi:hypothetical protein